MHQVGFSLNEYIEMHGQQNIKTVRFFGDIMYYWTTERTFSRCTFL